MSKAPRPRTEIVPVDKTLATLLLEKNRTNRRMRQYAIDKYAKLMQGGQWILNNDAIVVSRADELLNGQHRLRAVIKSGCTISMLILWDADPESFETMDRPLTRSVADALGQRGFVNTHTLAAALRAHLQLETKGWDNNDALEPRAALQLLEATPRFEHSHRGVVLTRGIITPGLAAALYYRLYAIDATAAEDFFARVGTGENLSMDNPIYRLRERLRRNRGVRFDRKIEAALIIKAWNAWRTDRKIQALGWREDEPFPEPR